MIHELKSPLPVVVTSKENKKGYAFFLKDYGLEHHNIWVVVMDDTGEIWDVPNPEIRVQNNWTMRRGKKNKDESSVKYVSNLPNATLLDSPFDKLPKANVGDVYDRYEGKFVNPSNLCSHHINRKICCFCK